MKKVYMVKLFQNGGSKAIRIPAEICPEGPEVFLWLDEEAQTIAVSANPPSNFAKFAALQKKLLPLLTAAELEHQVAKQLPLQLPTFMQEPGASK